MPSRAEEMSKLMHVVATALYGRNGGGPPDDDKKGGPSCASAEGTKKTKKPSKNKKGVSFS
ncbi:hypothetical protein TGAMA5MH_08617 [Trichoderma gamsii]|uniref:Uncharacterized protein n=1 Tax=Trichoderma gamsii TaxID=398673 RepID=A0A2K0T1K7_9HYPO|nr:hypothetical protein TGAMA5MH_08617 [Trichoderma gamsii]